MKCDECFESLACGRELHFQDLEELCSSSVLGASGFLRLPGRN